MPTKTARKPAQTKSDLLKELRATNTKLDSVATEYRHFRNGTQKNENKANARIKELEKERADAWRIKSDGDPFPISTIEALLMKIRQISPGVALTDFRLASDPACRSVQMLAQCAGGTLEFWYDDKSALQMKAENWPIMECHYVVEKKPVLAQ